MNPMWIIARKTLQDGCRNRWLLSLSVVFGALSMLVALGTTVSGGTLGIGSWHDSLSALTTLSAVLVPLVAILLSYDSFVGEREEGTLLLMLSYPISRAQFLLGKFSGQALLLALSVLVGFGSTALLLAISLPQTEGLVGSALWLIGSTVLLGWVFIALGYWISLGAVSKGRAITYLFMLWFFLALFADLIILGLLVSPWSGEWLRALIVINPVDAFRLSNLLLVEHDSIAGVLSLFPKEHFGAPVMLLGLLSWLALLLWQCQRRLARLLP